MTGQSFVDTNVLVYAVDGADQGKQARAQDVLRRAADSTLVLSAQVLGEFYVTVTRKLDRPVEPTVARQMIERLRRLPVAPIDADDVTRAVERSQEWGISYWDALIITSAITAGCDRVLSEDLADGHAYGGVRVENPFREVRRVSEHAETYRVRKAARELWSDTDLLDALGRYEQEADGAGMTPSAVHSYWDYARRFLAWRTGDYQPRGSSIGDRPVPTTGVSTQDLVDQARAYARVLEVAGLSRAAIDTYHRHAMFFIRWLAGDFQPGQRLTGRRAAG